MFNNILQRWTFTGKPADAQYGMSGQSNSNSLSNTIASVIAYIAGYNSITASLECFSLSRD